MWLVTVSFGAREVRQLKLSSMSQPTGLAGFTDLSDGGSADGRSAKWPFYYCSTVSFAPFLVRVDYGWQSGGLCGDGASDLYLWVFGAVVKIYEIDHWSI